MSFMQAREHGSKTGSGFISAEQGVSSLLINQSSPPPPLSQLPISHLYYSPISQNRLLIGENVFVVSLSKPSTSPRILTL
jgi:hypothetical protein